MKKLSSRPLAFCILFTAFTALSSCGVSPILNHQDATTSSAVEAGKSSQKDSSAPACPLAFPNHDFCGELIWDATPNDQGPASFHLRFWNVKQGTREFGPYADPSGNISVLLWMPAMGHGSAPVKLSHSKDLQGHDIPGLYSVSSAYFVMPGLWDVHVQWKEGSSLSEEAIESVQI